jgi:hypothetical protein
MGVVTINTKISTKNSPVVVKLFHDLSHGGERSVTFKKKKKITTFFSASAIHNILSFQHPATIVLTISSKCRI